MWLSKKNRRSLCILESMLEQFKIQGPNKAIRYLQEALRAERCVTI